MSEPTIEVLVTRAEAEGLVELLGAVEDYEALAEAIDRPMAVSQSSFDTGRRLAAALAEVLDTLRATQSQG